MHVIYSPLRVCGNTQNAEHFFFTCTMCRHQRVELMIIVSQRTNTTLNVLLYGDVTLPQHINSTIFDAVQKDINDTRRF